MKNLKVFVTQSLQRLWPNRKLSVKSDPSRTQDDVVPTSPPVHTFSYNPIDFVYANGQVSPIPKISTQESWDSEVMPNERVVVLFFALWSPPDKMFTEVLTKIAPEFEDITFLRFDIDKLMDETNEEIMKMAHLWRIATTPTLVRLRNGEQLASSVGYLGEESLRTLLTDWSEL